MIIDIEFSKYEYLTIQSGSAFAEILIYLCVFTFLLLAIMKLIKGFKNVH